MPGTETEKPAYRFGSFELDNRRGELRKSGIRIRLQEQPRRILVLLLENPGEIVTREQIQKSLWPDQTFVDFDNAINSAVRRLRDVLSDTAENPRFIETVARRGYRFLANVSMPAPSAPDAAPRQIFTTSVPEVVAPVRKNRQWLILVAALLGAVLISLVAPRLARTGGSGETAEVRLLPLTSNAGMEYHPSFSPDGTRIAYAWNGAEGKNFSIFVKLIGAGEPVRVTRDTARDFSPAWSPDGRWIAALRDYGREAAIILIPSSGGQHRELARLRKAEAKADDCVPTENLHVCGFIYWGPLLAWSPDGKYLFTSGYAKPDSPLSLFRISVETGDKSPITSPPAGITGDFGQSHGTGVS